MDVWLFVAGLVLGMAVRSLLDYFMALGNKERAP